MAMHNLIAVGADSLKPSNVHAIAGSAHGGRWRRSITLLDCMNGAAAVQVRRWTQHILAVDEDCRGN
jgi:hypothetical protein